MVRRTRNNTMKLAKALRNSKVTIKGTRRSKKAPDKLLRKKFKTRLHYVDTVSIDAGAAAITSHVFRANGIFDPDFTGTGHQPLLRDEFAALYAEYRVTWAKIKVTPLTSGTANVIPALWGVMQKANSALDYSLATSVIEDKSNKTGYSVHFGVTSTEGAYGNKRNAITRVFNAKRLMQPSGFNVSHPVGGDPGVGETDNYFHIWVGSILGNNPGALAFLVELTYDVTFSDPIVATPS